MTKYLARHKSPSGVVTSETYDHYGLAINMLRGALGSYAVSDIGPDVYMPLGKFLLNLPEGTEFKLEFLNNTAIIERAS